MDGDKVGDRDGGRDGDDMATTWPRGLMDRNLAPFERGSGTCAGVAGGAEWVQGKPSSLPALWGASAEAWAWPWTRSVVASGAATPPRRISLPNRGSSA
jgi:hypothetical protein